MGHAHQQFFNDRGLRPLVADHPFATARPHHVISKVMITIKDIYGDVKLTSRCPPSKSPTWAWHGGYVYRFAFTLRHHPRAASGSRANWYPIDIAVQTKSDYKRDRLKWWKNYSAYQIEFTAGDQMRIIWPADISVVVEDVVLFHGDGTPRGERDHRPARSSSSDRGAQPRRRDIYRPT